MKIKTLPLFFFILAILASCKKDRVTSGVPDKQLIINLQPSYLNGSLIDSAIAIGNFTGQQQSIKLTAKENQLKTSLSYFGQGSGKLIIQLFTHLEQNDQPLQFEQQVEVNLASPQSLTVTGPTSFTDQLWTPRVILDYEFPTGGLRHTAVVGLRPGDPYFEIKNLPPGWNKRIKVYRGFYMGNYTSEVYGKTWDCNSNCFGNQVNREFFSGLQEDLANKTWDRQAIEVSFYGFENYISELAYTLEK